MKAILNYPLYRRPQPTNAIPAHGFLPKDSVIDVEEVVQGKAIDKITDWYRANDGFYYWGGGVVNKAEFATNIVSKVDYNSLLSPPPEWRTLNGLNVNIAILDTGCFLHESIKTSIAVSYNVIDKTSDVNDTSDSGHGTFVAGIIASKQNKEVNGIAVNSRLIIIKVADTDENVIAENVFEGLRWLVNDCPVKADIVNISLQFAPGHLKDGFDKQFDHLKNQGVVVYAGAQNDNGLSTELFYPASAVNVIAVGALSSQSSIVTNDVAINNKVKYVVPNLIYNSLRNDAILIPRTNSGCSFATATLSGYSALALSYFKETKASDDLNTLITGSIKAFNPQTFSDKFHINKIL